MLALQDSLTGRFLDGLGAALPRPKAIIVVSAHFAAAQPSVGAALHPVTVHDFGGFPQPLYDIRYPAPGSPDLAAGITERLAAAGLEPHERPNHGLDHGVWVPLRRMYPQADIPVVPLSVNPHADAAHHYQVGRALAPLRDAGVLVIGSGGFVHNLADLDWQHSDAAMPGWASGFADWMRARVEAVDLPALLDWERQAACGPRPSDRRAPDAALCSVGCRGRRAGRAQPASLARVWFVGAGRIFIRLALKQKP